jgi:hypothetical protein
MELYKDILAHALLNEQVEISFRGRKPNIENIVNNACYQALVKIKTVIEDDSLEDKECFMKIEKIICAFEELGSTCGARHDFG